MPSAGQSQSWHCHGCLLVTHCTAPNMTRLCFGWHVDWMTIACEHCSSLLAWALAHQISILRHVFDHQTADLLLLLLLSVHLYSALSLQIPNALHALCQYLANRKHLSDRRASTSFLPNCTRMHQTACYISKIFSRNTREPTPVALPQTTGEGREKKEWGEGGKGKREGEWCRPACCTHTAVVVYRGSL